MNMIVICLLFLCLVPAHGLALSNTQIERLADKIWQNEGAGKTQYLTHWNKHETFASLGIGHFIWYPKHIQRRPYQASFPELLEYLKAQKVSMPTWLKQAKHCPWPNRTAFYQQFDSSKMKALRLWLEKTTPYQAQFMANRLQTALSSVLNHAPAQKRSLIQKHLTKLQQSAHGLYILMDYINFKGEGINPSERYQGKGWGLLQVLANMPESKITSVTFAKAADFVLTRRVLLAPKEEAQWLPGWRKRLATYTEQ